MWPTRINTDPECQTRIPRETRPLLCCESNLSSFETELRHEDPGLGFPCFDASDSTLTRYRTMSLSMSTADRRGTCSCAWGIAWILTPRNHIRRIERGRSIPSPNHPIRNRLFRHGLAFTPPHSSHGFTNPYHPTPVPVDSEGDGMSGVTAAHVDSELCRNIAPMSSLK